MNKLWIASTLGAALALAGCANAHDNAVSALTAASVVEENICKKLERDPSVISLKGKLPFWGNDRTKDMLENQEKASEEERTQLEAYLQGTTTCYNSLNEAVSKYTSKEEMAVEKAYQLQDYLLISDLKGGFISWGEFNRREYKLFPEWREARHRLYLKNVADEEQTNEALRRFGQGLAQGMQQYGNAMSRAYAPQQQYGSSYAPTPAYEPATTWTSHGNIVQGSNGVTMQSFGNRDVITYPNGQTRNCSTFGNITTCSSPPGF